jgi:hypothetical protein
LREPPNGSIGRAFADNASCAAHDPDIPMAVEIRDLTAETIGRADVVRIEARNV